jgi:hypothetical protein
MPPTEIIEAVSELWALVRPGPDNLLSAPAFVRLREACQRHYGEPDSKEGLGFALANALRSFGLPCNADSGNARFSLTADEAAVQLDRAFRRTQVRRLYLCPLDCADDVPQLTFGPNAVRTISADELTSLVDVDRLKRTSSAWHFDANRFAAFSWLLIEQHTMLDREPGARALPAFYVNLGKDFGEIEPHKRKFDAAVEDALFALLLAPWEEWVSYRDVDWRAFRIPWVYSVSDDMFVRPSQPPSADSLSWESDVYVDDFGEQVEVERPTHLPLDNTVAKAPDWINETGWQSLQRARQSPLFSTPIAHFLVRAFITDDIDEFLAHIMVIEAALGQSVDHAARTRPVIAGRNPGATARVAARLAALLNSAAAGDDFKRLFDVRSQFIHGRQMANIPSAERIVARRLARAAVSALVGVALRQAATTSRDQYLESLLVSGAQYL